MKLNLDFYQRQEDELTHSEINLIKEQNEKDCKIDLGEEAYEKVIISSNIEQNILNWYPFIKESTILQINANFGQITRMLCEKSKRVVGFEKSLKKAKIIQKNCESNENLELIVGNWKNIKQEEKFDYIVMIGLELEEEGFSKIFERLKELITPKGIILIAVNNILGLRTLNGIENVVEEKKEENLVGRNEIINVINQSEISNFKFYYPLPNYKVPNIIFTDNHLPSRESILRNMALNNENAVISFDEREVYRKMLKENSKLFPSFANSFLVEISKEKIQNKIERVSFGNFRKPEYRLKTVILNDEVYKEEINELSKNHLLNIKENNEILNKLNVNTLDMWKNDKIYSRLIKDIKSFDKQLIEVFNNQGIEDCIYKIKEFEEDLRYKLGKSDDKSQTVFEKYNISKIKNIKGKKLTYVKYGIFDLIFQNCFVIDNKFYFYDQEWMEKNLPLEFIIYRAIFYLGSTEKTLDVNKIYSEMGLLEYIEVFEQLENILQEKVRSNEIWNIHAKNNKTVKNMHDEFVHIRNVTSENHEKQMQESRNTIEIQKKELEEKNKTIENRENELNYIKNSKSWKITRPFRLFRKKIGE